MNDPTEYTDEQGNRVVVNEVAARVVRMENPQPAYDPLVRQFPRHKPTIEIHRFVSVTIKCACGECSGEHTVRVDCPNGDWDKCYEQALATANEKLTANMTTLRERDDAEDERVKVAKMDAAAEKARAEAAAEHEKGLADHAG